jgi:hypothetical protein
VRDDCCGDETEMFCLVRDLKSISSSAWAVYKLNFNNENQGIKAKLKER